MCYWFWHFNGSLWLDSPNQILKFAVEVIKTNQQKFLIYSQTLNHPVMWTLRPRPPLTPTISLAWTGIIIPESTDTLRWVSATQTWAYTVYFENDAELAMAAVSKVTITVPLHEKLNYATFGVGDCSHIL